MADTRISRRFDRLAARASEPPELERLIAERLLEHLDPIRLSPARLLDLGSGWGSLLDELARRYPGAHLLAADASARMAAHSAARRIGWLRRARAVQADAERLPLRAASLDLIVSSNLLPWCDPGALIAECARLLREGGLLLLATPGPETLAELRGCAASPADPDRPVILLDMHDLGDALLAGGFGGVVCESERLTLLYRDLAHLHAELRALGAAPGGPARRRGLAGRAWLQALRRDYEGLRRDGSLPATLELVYAHAWRGAERARGPLAVAAPRYPGR